METRKRSSWAWFWQAVTGIALLLLLGLHMVAHHFIVQGGLRNYAEVLAYLSNPVILVLEIAFLISVTTHAMLGVRAILFDLGLSAGAERTVTYACTAFGVVIVLYGFWLTYTILNYKLVTALLQ